MARPGGSILPEMRPARRTGIVLALEGDKAGPGGEGSHPAARLMMIDEDNDNGDD
jgi:hypothetical protein